MRVQNTPNLSRAHHTMNETPELKPADILWKVHEDAIFGKGHTAHRTPTYREVRRAFYGGIYSAIAALAQSAHSQSIPDPDAGAEYAEALAHNARDMIQTMAAEDTHRAQAKKNLGKIILPNGRRNGE